MQPEISDRCASDMAFAHNLMGRWLNSIYLQAPHIKPADEKGFARYTPGWAEQQTGLLGLMEANISQHEAFHDGLDAFKVHIDNLLSGQANYEGLEIVALADAFLPALMTYLVDEVPTIQGLRK
ncbi:hypothetical protein B0T22DRAFT_461010 [Podospora appendiculata]|uniref:Hemerythrin-like domain-containing protein n=1 Tax=Podospora appendiculata TaxID=314037 RepID=A0AAE0XAL8_9PEZI|nr:hypothetical protein B0T22DRAFT_461010 [Podospora appendiculata]